MKCPLCGGKVSEDDLFCGSCGYNLLQNKPDSDELQKAPDPVEKAMPPSLGAVLAGASEAEDAFALPETGEDERPPREGKTWKTFVIAAVVLAVLLFCCCSTVFALLYFAGEYA